MVTTTIIFTIVKWNCEIHVVLEHCHVKMRAKHGHPKWKMAIKWNKLLITAGIQSSHLQEYRPASLMLDADINLSSTYIIGQKRKGGSPWSAKIPPHPTQRNLDLEEFIVYPRNFLRPIFNEVILYIVTRKKYYNPPPPDTSTLPMSTLTPSSLSPLHICPDNATGLTQRDDSSWWKYLLQWRMPKQGH